MTEDMACRKPWWHPKGTCENTDRVVASQLRKMESDLFKKNGCMPAAQNEIMNRNASVSPFLRLPPEIRVRIYKLLLGGQHIWIDSYPSSTDIHGSHHGKSFYHLNTIDHSGRGFDIRLLRVCRQVFTETALLPYALNKFTFSNNSVRKEFERLVRPGKKQAQKTAIGAYDVCNFSTFQNRLKSLMPEEKCNKTKGYRRSN